MINVIGRLRSGKSYIGQEIATALGIKYYEVSDIVSEVVGKVKEAGREALQTALKGEKGSNLLFDAIRTTIGSNTDCVLSGSREAAHVAKMFNPEGNNDIVVLVKADEYTRYARTCEVDGYVTPAQFEEMNKKDKDLGLDILMSMKHNDFNVFVINNSLTNDRFRRDLQIVISKIKAYRGE